MQGWMPIGVWVVVRIGEEQEVIGFTYQDPSAGFNAAGWVRGGDRDAHMIVRCPDDYPWRLLEDAEREELGLPDVPDWVVHYGPQPKERVATGPWAAEPALRGRLHPEYPEDLMVLAHDGGPRFSPHPAEGIWVRLTGGSGTRFRGVALNQPHHLETVSEGQEIQFIVPAAGHPVMVTETYLADRERWKIGACDACGCDELFDPPLALAKATFEGMPPLEPSQRLQFTSRCPSCGEGMLMVEQIADV